MVQKNGDRFDINVSFAITGKKEITDKEGVKSYEYTAKLISSPIALDGTLKLTLSENNMNLGKVITGELEYCNDLTNDFMLENVKSISSTFDEEDLLAGEELEDIKFAMNELKEMGDWDER